MKRWIGLDVGTRTIGVAVSDPLGFTAQPVATLERLGKKTDVPKLIALADQYDAAGFVFGLPLRTDGTEGPEAEGVRRFAAHVESGKPSLKQAFEDERFTTAIAQKVLQEARVRGRKKKKQVVDRMAAQLILQSWLDRTGGAL